MTRLTPSASTLPHPTAQDRIFEEFNTLSVIYSLPAERFITNERAKVALANNVAAEGNGTNGAGSGNPVAVAQQEENSEEESDDDEEEVLPVAMPPAPPPAPPQASPMDDLLGLMDDLPAATQPPQQAAVGLALSPPFTLDPAAFQQQWGVLPTSDTWTMGVANPSITEVLVQRLAPKHVKCMAFGAQADVAKFYFYAMEANTGSVLLSELQISKSTGQASAIVKSPNPAIVPRFSLLLKTELGC